MVLLMQRPHLYETGLPLIGTASWDRRAAAAIHNLGATSVKLNAKLVQRILLLLGSHSILTRVDNTSKTLLMLELET